MNSSYHQEVNWYESMHRVEKLDLCACDPSRVDHDFVTQRRIVHKQNTILHHTVEAATYHTQLGTGGVRT